MVTTSDLIKTWERLMARGTYVEYLGEIQMGDLPLNDDALRQIGEFTRENVSRWLERQVPCAACAAAPKDYDVNKIGRLPTICPFCSGKLHRHESEELYCEISTDVIGQVVYLQCEQCGATARVEGAHAPNIVPWWDKNKQPLNNPAKFFDQY